MSEEIRALIFNKVQGSFVDGFGIRTTIFLKGCPLRCKWCCNPEGQSFRPELKVTYDKCTGCGRCVDLCPEKALSMKDGLVVVDREKCTVCGDCADFCYTGALEPFGRYWTVDEMFESIKRDKPFFDASGGGLTIGGGEATWHPEFVLALMEKCQNEGINVAVDTCGYVDTPEGLEILRKADLLLFDIKGMDPEMHIKGTGVSNDIIWRNLKMRNELGKPVIIRIPIIPGYNDSDENLRAAAECLSMLTCIRRVDLLPFHQYGLVKYKQIGMEYTMADTPGIPEERQQEIKKMFEDYGFNVQIGG